MDDLTGAGEISVTTIDIGGLKLTIMVELTLTS